MKVGDRTLALDISVWRSKMNTAEAIAHIETLPHEDLADWCYDSFKDFYGVKGHHMRGQGWTKQDYMDWILQHFTWNEETQCWHNAVPFIGEDEEWTDPKHILED
jgi:hypothetical protein